MEMITNVNHIPPELIEKILTNLPLKSLLRFSAASNLWNSIIFRPKFVQSYRGREMIVFLSYRRNDTETFNNSPLACRLSSLSSDNPTDKATPLEFPRGSFLASCGSLWCLEVKESLLLCNPSIQTYRELSKSPKPETQSYDYVSPFFNYGLGYDSVCDDYKIVTINLWKHHVFWQRDETQIYSLRNDCWRKVEPPHSIIFHKFLTSKGLFLSGKIHWLINNIENVWIDEQGAKHTTDYTFILSFDLSEEKFGQIELPELPKERRFKPEDLDMFLFGGKLRVCESCRVNVGEECVFSVWVMEDYELKLWTKEMKFDYGHMPGLSLTSLKPFYFYDDDGNVVRAVISMNEREKLFICKEDVGSSSSSTSTLVGKNFGSNGFRYVDSFTYIESFVFCNWQSWNSMKTDAADDNDNAAAAADDDNNDDEEDDDDDDLMMMVETLGKWRSYK